MAYCKTLFTPKALLVHNNENESRRRPPAARALIDLELIEGQGDKAQELVQAKQVPMEHSQFDLPRLLVWNQAERQCNSGHSLVKATVVIPWSKQQWSFLGYKSCLE